MTLTGHIPPEDRECVEKRLKDHFEPLLDGDFQIDAITVFEQECPEADFVATLPARVFARCYWRAWLVNGSSRRKHWPLWSGRAAPGSQRTHSPMTYGYCSWVRSSSFSLYFWHLASDDLPSFIQVRQAAGDEVNEESIDAAFRENAN
ncbi:DUF1045 domain-containing protein [Mesorhizobium sp. M0435]|uniref:DUF1045 domain-containing protein n=1 Tax=Mesorhizobium sp. M0435 TaxID=2956944 RepID=UPI003335B40F